MRWTQEQVNDHNARLYKSVRLVQDAVEDESDLHNQIMAECRKRGWIALHGAMSERTHRNLGEPDFCCICSGGRVFFIECKANKSKLRPAQLAMKVQAEMLGHTIHIVRSFGEFLDLIQTKPKQIP